MSAVSGELPHGKARPTGTLHAVVSRNVRARMGLRRWSGSELARQAGVHVSEVNAQLGGRIGWNLRSIECVASALGVEPADLLRRETDGAA